MTVSRASVLTAAAFGALVAANSFSTAADEDAARTMLLSHVVHDGKNLVSVRVGDIELQAESLTVVYGDGQRAAVSATADGKVRFEGKNGKTVAGKMSSPIQGGMFGQNGNRPFGSRR